MLAGLENHVYIYNKEVKKQRPGRGTGYDLTRTAARLLMLDWDQKFLELARENEALQPGKRWSEEEQRILHPHLIEENLNTPADQRKINEVVKMNNSTNPTIRLRGA